ncbi:hypothetical protein SLEP1_g43079 [Rubroshorea leprosula]|uniref:Uncharacterized protein n=1 Tax=Rubroshorea leprosula TaxID=152421 RepID=A0AAV5LBU8_9ROSI|nr:hypothetical protein SLEP1_g43079 [Rubroshorea leprosula]
MASAELEIDAFGAEQVQEARPAVRRRGEGTEACKAGLGAGQGLGAECRRAEARDAGLGAEQG